MKTFSLISVVFLFFLPLSIFAQATLQPDGSITGVNPCPIVTPDCAVRFGDLTAINNAIGLNTAAANGASNQSAANATAIAATNASLAGLTIGSTAPATNQEQVDQNSTVNAQQNGAIASNSSGIASNANWNRIQDLQIGTITTATSSNTQAINNLRSNFDFFRDETRENFSQVASLTGLDLSIPKGTSYIFAVSGARQDGGTESLAVGFAGKLSNCNCSLSIRSTNDFIVIGGSVSW